MTEKKTKTFMPRAAQLDCGNLLRANRERIEGGEIDSVAFAEFATDSIPATVRNHNVFSQGFIQRLSKELGIKFKARHYGVAKKTMAEMEAQIYMMADCLAQAIGEMGGCVRPCLGDLAARHNCDESE